MRRYEVSALRQDVNVSRKATQKNCKSLKQVVNIARDTSEVKTLIHDVHSSNLTSMTTYARSFGGQHREPAIASLQ